MRKLLAAALILAGMSYAQTPVLRINAEEAEHHRLGQRHVLHSSEPLSFRDEDYVELTVTVSAEGTVVTANPTGGNKHFFVEAGKVALTWKYAPFEKDGRAIMAEVQDYAHIVPPEKRPPTPVPFPEVADWKSLKLTLSRSGCFGACPAYKLAVHGDGSASYAGHMFVKYCGEYRGHISLGAVREIVSYFRAADYFWLLPEYRYGVTDEPAYKTSIAFDGKQMSVIDYVGHKVGMPMSVIDVEDAIDRLADPETWTSRELISSADPKECEPPPAAEVDLQRRSLPASSLQASPQGATIIARHVSAGDRVRE